MRPSAPVIGVDQQACRPGFSGRVAAVLPERVLGDVRDDDLALQRDGRGAGPEADLGRVVVHERDVFARQAGAGDVLQHALDRVVEADAADRRRQHALDDLGDRGERRCERLAGGDLLERAALARRDQLGLLALGDVDDAGADQVAAGARQAHEAHFARDQLALGILVQPLEDRRLAPQRSLDVTAGDCRTTACRRPARAGSPAPGRRAAGPRATS